MPAKLTIKVARGLQRAALLLPEMVRKELNSFSLEGNSWDFPSPLLSIFSSLGRKSLPVPVGSSRGLSISQYRPSMIHLNHITFN